MMKIKSSLILFTFLVLVSCTSKKDQKPSISKEAWGTADGKDVSLFTLTNKNGMLIKISSRGGAITTILVPDKAGKFENVVIGFDDLKSYQSGHPYFGSIVGRYGNRIAKGKFSLNGTEYTLAINNAPNHLHGGNKGFDKQVWDADGGFATADSAGLTLTYLSKDMEEGYPGNLKLKVNYVLTNDNEIKIRYEAETDKATVLNPTNHSYFNLSSFKETILNHELVLFSDSVTPTDSTLIPIGVQLFVKGTAFDFTTAHKIGERISKVPGGYDNNYKLRKKDNELSLAAEVYEPVSGRLLQAYTTEPGIQFYTGNFLDGTYKGHDGVKYEKYAGLCLEAQHFPDSPNQPKFPSVVLNPGQKYNQLTVYKFSTR
jgi:aldose 1-epimerase